nr:hypothetical protein [Tanacetum cinerariifolium]
MSHLLDSKEFDRGYVTFGGGAKGGRITGKGTLKTSKLDFEDVDFVKELKFNLLSVSQIVDMKNIIPKESLTGLVVKATLDESMVWHRRLRETLLMALPDKNQLKFNIHKDAKTLMEAIKKRFGVNDVPGVFAASSKATVSTLLNVDSLSDAEMDLKWQMAMLTMRASRFLKRTGKTLGTNGTDTIGFDMSKVECYNCHRRGHFARECRSPRDNRNKDTPRRTVLVEADEEPTNYALIAYASSGSSSSLRSDNETSSKNLSKLLGSQVSDKTGLRFDSQVFNSQVFDYEEEHSHEYDNIVPKSLENDRYKTDEGYHAVPPTYTRTFLPCKLDLVFNDTPNVSETVAHVFNVELSTNKPTKDMSKTLRSDAPIVEDWISDTEDETKNESVPKQREPSFGPPSEHVKTPRESVKKFKHPKQAKNLRTNNQKSRDHKKNWIRKLVLFVEA